jgi:hypothetical protein
VLQIVEHRLVKLSNTTFGHIYHLNYPQAMPSAVDFTQHLMAPLGHVVSIELQGVEFAENGCVGNESLEVWSINALAARADASKRLKGRVDKSKGAELEEFPWKSSGKRQTECDAVIDESKRKSKAGTVERDFESRFD